MSINKYRFGMAESKSWIQNIQMKKAAPSGKKTPTTTVKKAAPSKGSAAKKSGSLSDTLSGTRRK